MSIREDFELFDSENPQVYELFKHFAFEAIRAGKKTLSSYLIIERIRWETEVVTRDEPFKVNNNYRPDYARKFMKDFPEHGGIFRTRQLRAV